MDIAHLLRSHANGAHLLKDKVWDDIPSSSEMIHAVFGGLGSWIPEVRHVITRLEWGILEEILRIFECKPGIWGQRPLDGDPSDIGQTCPLSYEVPFTIWETPTNAAYLERIFPALGWHGFDMVIATDVKVRETESLWPGRDRNLTDFDGIFERVPLVLEAIGWAFIPVAEVFPVALITIAEAQTSQFNRLVSWLQETKHPYATLQRSTRNELEWKDWKGAGKNLYECIRKDKLNEGRGH